MTHSGDDHCLNQPTTSEHRVGVAASLCGTSRGQIVNYVAQTETHLPTLTVRETLEFAHECCGSPAENAVPGGSTEVHYPDVILRTLGLDNCQHTIVGGGMHRGISGGEKRRLTTGEMEFGMKISCRATNFFRTSSYVVATMLVPLPLAVMETIVFGSLINWVGGFMCELGAFLMFELLLLLILLVFLSLVFFLAAASPNLSIAEPVAMACVLFYVLFTGFIVSKNQIPDWLVWLYWLDPVAWTVRSVAVSQYRHPELDVCVYGAFDCCAMYNQTMGEFSLGLFDVPSAKFWIGYGIIVSPRLNMASDLVTRRKRSYALRVGVGVRPLAQHAIHTDGSNECLAWSHRIMKTMNRIDTSELHVGNI